MNFIKAGGADTFTQRAIPGSGAQPGFLHLPVYWDPDLASARQYP